MTYTKEEREEIKSILKDRETNEYLKEHITNAEVEYLIKGINADEKEEAKLLNKELDEQYKLLPWYKKLFKTIKYV